MYENDTSTTQFQASLPLMYTSVHFESSESVKNDLVNIIKDANFNQL